MEEQTLNLAHPGNRTLSVGVHIKCPTWVLVFEPLVIAEGVLGKAVHLWEVGLAGENGLLEGVG